MGKTVIDAAKENPNIIYLGFQDKLNIARYMKKCKALIVPSIWYEGFPLTVLEAFSTGTLVIASRLGSISEIIQDRVNGLLFEAGNEIALVNKIVEVDTEPEWAKHIGENARLDYLKHYTPEINYGQLTAIYSKALALKKQTEERRDKIVHHSMATFSDS